MDKLAKMKGIKVRCRCVRGVQVGDWWVWVSIDVPMDGSPLSFICHFPLSILVWVLREKGLSKLAGSTCLYAACGLSPLIHCVPFFSLNYHISFLHWHRRRSQSAESHFSFLPSHTPSHHHAFFIVVVEKTIKKCYQCKPLLALQSHN